VAKLTILLASAFGAMLGGFAAAAVDDTPAVKGYMAAMQTMHKDMMVDYTGDADVDFVRGMIPHHQGAIDMAKIVKAFGSDPEIRALVYVDAFIPDQGDTIGGLASAEPGSCLDNEAFIPVPYPGAPSGDVDLYIKPDLVPGCFATGLPASQAALIAATQRPLTASAFTGPSGPPAWKTIPSWAVVGSGDRVIPPAELTFMAKRAGARITDVDAGHLSLISEAPVVTRVILEAVEATG